MFRNAEEKDFALYMELAQEFYHSPAVMHPIPTQYMENTFREAMRSDVYIILRILEVDGEAAGLRHSLAQLFPGVRQPDLLDRGAVHPQGIPRSRSRHEVPLVRPQGVSLGASAARGRAGKYRRGRALQASRLHAARVCELRRRAGRRGRMSDAVTLRSYAGEADAAAERIAAFRLAHSDYVQTREESLDDLRAPSSDTESTGGEGNHVVS